ncbi:MAG: helix-turn-helix transcriptional regulator [Oscillospiraceae bacterium]|nr:helix-turn-helix transcriptional regulator [Oscillospiraceae bacterium]
MDNSIITIKEYGKIKIRLKEIMDSRGISRNSLSKGTNTRYEVISKWYNNNVEKLDLDVLARLCFVLDCTPQELIEYEYQK